MSSEIREVLIIESPVIHQVMVESVSKTKARLKTVLQAVDVPGRNRRRYRQSIVESSLREKKPIMEARRFFGELDHPISDDPVRNATVLLQNASHIILDTWIEDGKVYGIVETLSTPSGSILYNLAAIDKVPVGFSLRALGSVKQESGFLDVVRMTMIAYDSVSDPSFTDAVVQEVNLQEVVRNIDIEEQRPLLEQKQPLICIGDKCYLVEHLDRIFGDEVKRYVEKLLWGF